MSEKFLNQHIFLIFIAALFLSSNVCSAQNKQWEMYNRIPSLKNIELKLDRKALDNGSYCGDELHMTINSDYTVKLTCDVNWMNLYNGSSSIKYNLSGTGLLVWKSGKMVLQLRLFESTPGGSYAFQKCYERTNYFQTADQCDNYEYSFSSTNRNYSCTFDVEYGVDENGEFFKLFGDDITLKLNGNEYLLYDISNRFNNRQEYNRSYEYRTKLKLTNKPIRFTSKTKSASEINAESSDIYGKWQWNSDRSVIVLVSTTGDCGLVLWKYDNGYIWGFNMNDYATGYKTEQAETGENLVYLMLSFDGASDQSFTFHKVGQQLYYVLYDRFTGKLRYDSSILQQIKDKRIMIVNYKLNGSDMTAMFQLEGLEAIYNAIIK